MNYVNSCVFLLKESPMGGHKKVCNGKVTLAPINIKNNAPQWLLTPTNKTLAPWNFTLGSTIWQRILSFGEDHVDMVNDGWLCLLPYYRCFYACNYYNTRIWVCNKGEVQFFAQMVEGELFCVGKCKFLCVGWSINFVHMGGAKKFCRTWTNML